MGQRGDPHYVSQRQLAKELIDDPAAAEVTGTFEQRRETIRRYISRWRKDTVPEDEWAEALARRFDTAADYFKDTPGRSQDGLAGGLGELRELLLDVVDRVQRLEDAQAR